MIYMHDDCPIKHRTMMNMKWCQYKYKNYWKGYGDAMAKALLIVIKSKGGKSEDIKR